MTQVINTKFTFKARKIMDDNNKEIGKTKKHAAVNVPIPQPTDAELISYLQIPDLAEGVVATPEQKAQLAVKSVIMDAVREVVSGQVKAQFDELIDQFGADESKELTAQLLDYDKLSLQYISQLEPGQRGAKAIPEEDWIAFYEDYLAVMVKATGKPEAKIKNHLELFKKPTRAKSSPDVMSVLVDQLDVYMASSGAIEDTGECTVRVRNRFKKWLAEEKALVGVEAL